MFLGQESGGGGGERGVGERESCRRRRRRRARRAFFCFLARAVCCRRARSGAALTANRIHRCRARTSKVDGEQIGKAADDFPHRADDGDGAGDRRRRAADQDLVCGRFRVGGLVGWLVGGLVEFTDREKKYLRANGPGREYWTMDECCVQKRTVTPAPQP